MNLSFSNYINKYITDIKNKRLLVCLSGGMDSIYLYHQLNFLSLKNNFQIGIAHVNYNTSSNSLKSMELCKKLAKNNNNPLYIRKVKLDPYNFEHNAREIRYSFFNSIKEVEKYDFILTAHHRDDLIETLYMQNSSSDDYSCIPLNQENNGILRPLIEVSKQDIENDVKIHNWSYFDDPSNQDTKYRRNKVRHEILPSLEDKARVIDSMLSCYQEKLSKYNKFREYFSSVKSAMITRSKNEIQFSREYLKKIDVYALKLIIQGQLNEVFNIVPMKSEKFWREIHDILVSKKIGLKKEIDSNLNLYFEKDYIVLLKEDFKSDCIKLKDKTNWMNYHFKVEDCNGETAINLNNKSIFLCSKEDYDQGLYVRKRSNGDKYKFQNDMSKNISDLFNEHKIPISRRDMLPVIVLNDKIQWIPGVAHAANSYLSSNNLVKVSAISI